jgi:PPOX class probable F420-dependent enzyme
MSAQPPAASGLLKGPAALDDPLVAELLHKRLIAVIATHEPDGAIHAVAVWYARAGDEILLGTGSRSRKVSNLRRDSRATLTLHDSRPGYEVCGACLIGRAEVVDGDAATSLVRRVHERYLRPGAAELPAVRAFMACDDAAIRFRPERAFTWDERGREAVQELAGTDLAYRLEPTSPRGSGARPGPVSQ